MDRINCNGDWTEDPVLKVTTVTFFRCSFSNCRFKKLSLASCNALIFIPVEFLLLTKLTPKAIIEIYNLILTYSTEQSLSLEANRF